MARGRRSKVQVNVRQRDPAAIAKPNESLLSRVNTPLNLTEIEDNRMFNPEAAFTRPPLNIYGRPSRYTVSAPVVRVSTRAPYVFKRPFGLNSVPVGLRFRAPLEVLVCIRRKQRREIMFAMRLRKKGAGSGRRRNRFSEVSCG